MGKLCRVNFCCCGATLRTGSLIIAIFEVFAIGVSILITALSIINLDELGPGDLYSTITGELVLTVADREVIRNMCIALIVICGVLLFTNFSLMYGIVKYRHSFFIPWFIGVVIMVITNTVTSIILLILATGVFTTANLASTVFGLVVFALLRLYFMIVVYSYYCTLKEERANTNPNPNIHFQAK